MSFQIKTEKRLSPENIKRIIAMGISLKDSVESIEQGLIEEYDSSKTYIPNMACYYNDYLYRCLFTTTGEFDINSWKKVGDSLELVNKAQVEAMLGLTQEEIETLQKIINDSQITLSTTYSSSKIFSDLQQCLNESKKFTLEEFAKANKASYTVTDSVDTMTDQSTIYLLKNDTTYDMYIVQVDGTPTKIGDVNIDLTQFYTKTEIDNDFVKKTDADGKYATITTVDGKVDKTSILSTISSTPSDDKLLSEKAIKSELDAINTNLDDKVNKASITTTIDSSSTDTQVPSAKAIYNKSKNRIIWLPSGGDIIAYADSIGEESVTETVRVMNATNTPYGVNNKSNDFYYTIYSMANSEYKRIIAYDVRTNGMYMIMKNNGAWHTWQRICTTSVADKSWTTIPESSITNATLVSGGGLTYSIKNGVCYIRLNGLVLSGNGNIEVPTGTFPLPDNSITNGHYPVVTNGNACLLTILSSSGGLTINCGTNTGTIYTTISYPVK